MEGTEHYPGAVSPATACSSTATPVATAAKAFQSVCFLRAAATSPHSSSGSSEARVFEVALGKLGEFRARKGTQFKGGAAGAVACGSIPRVFLMGFWWGLG